MIDMAEFWLVNRAVRAYFDAVANPAQLNCHYDAPGIDSGVIEHRGTQYVVLRNDFRGPFAVFSVRDDGQLERLHRWPAAVTSSARING
jgi:hypothetical protein